MYGGDRDIVFSDFENVRVVALLGEWEISNRDRLHEALLSLGAVGDSNMRRLLELTSLDGLFGVSAQHAKYLSERLPGAATQA